MKKAVSVVLIASLLTPSFAWSQSPPSQPDPIVYPMDTGEKAPFDGVLFNSTAVATVNVKYKTAEQETQIAVEKAVNDCNAVKTREVNDVRATCGREKSEIGAKYDTCTGTLSEKEKENSALKKQIAESPRRDVWFGIGFGGGILFTLLTVFAVGQVAK